MSANRYFCFVASVSFIISACAPEVNVTETEISPPPVSSATPLLVLPSGTLAVPTITGIPAAVMPIATSRGPDLEATDPATVNLASGGLQLVEFFRFT